MFKMIVNDDFWLPDQCPPVIRDLLTKLLYKYPKKRLGYNGFEEVMGHEFFVGVDW